MPKNGKVVFGNNVVLNSDFANTNTSLTFRCKFVTGYGGKIVVGDNTMFNGVCVVSYEEVEIGRYCQIASSTILQIQISTLLTPLKEKNKSQVTNADQLIIFRIG
jgi:hypothetical protein